MGRLTSYENECNREMICRHEDCCIDEEYCPHLNEDNCLCLQEVIKKLAEYEDLEEQGRILIVPEIPKNKTLYWIWGDEIMPVTYKRITSCVVTGDGNPHIMCEMVTQKDGTFIRKYRRKPIEHTFKKGDKRYFYADEIGKTVFLTQAEAEETLKGMKKE